jgi:cell fate (sporulation/competence/biofilm development) regulator YlbF (YheA/YmcA/DUF963 family)
MPVETPQIMEEAEKLGRLAAQHPAVARYKQAQKAMADDAEASRLMAEFERHYETLARQEQAGMHVTDAQRMQLEALQSRIVSNLKIKALNVAQVDFVDLLRKISQAIQRQVVESSPGGGAKAAPTGGAAGAPAAAAGPAGSILTG